MKFKVFKTEILLIAIFPSSYDHVTQVILTDSNTKLFFSKPMSKQFLHWTFFYYHRNKLSLEISLMTHRNEENRGRWAALCKIISGKFLVTFIDKNNYETTQLVQNTVSNNRTLDGSTCCTAPWTSAWLDILATDCSSTSMWCWTFANVC